jgi:hypothetical protein
MPAVDAAAVRVARVGLAAVGVPILAAPTGAGEPRPEPPATSQMIKITLSRPATANNVI